MPVTIDHPLSFQRVDRELCFDRMRPELRMPETNIRFPTDLGAYAASFKTIRCVVMQGGQGDVKHWAFNDPPQRTGLYIDEPMPPGEYRRLGTRITDLHPMTTLQNARMSRQGCPLSVPTKAATVGPVETFMADRVSIWHPGYHDNAFGMRLTSFMIARRIVDTSVPMSLLADHPNVHFHFLRDGIGQVEV